MKLKRGSCSAVIGKVGSGKSSLLSALIGELYWATGTKLKIDKKIAYTSQTAWTLSKTIKENILMGKEYNEEKFKQALKYSCFADDLKEMPQGEMTILGNKGVGLSGGQKARLSIARAMYSDADVYLFDDPISALDINVGKAVMEEGILKHLKSRTVLVVTHALAFLPYFDNIYVMEEGRIILSGNYTQLQENSKFNEIYKDLKETQEKEEKEKDKEDNDIANTLFKPPEKDLEVDVYEVPNREETPIGVHQFNVLVLNKSKSASKVPSHKQSRRGSEHISSVHQMQIMEQKEQNIVEQAINIEDKAQGTIDRKVFMAYVKIIGWPKFIVVVLCKLFAINCQFAASGRG